MFEWMDVEFRVAELPTGRFVVLCKFGGAIRCASVPISNREEARKEMERLSDWHNEKMKEFLHGDGAGPPFGFFS